MPDIARLKTELTDDPLSRGYAGMTDKQAADNLNDVIDRIPPGFLVESSVVFQQVDQAEYDALTNANEDKMWNVLHLGMLDPWGVEASLLTDVFGAGSTTITTLQAWRNGLRVSRAAELNLGFIREGHVAEARA
jgi:hypothetical protein